MTWKLNCRQATQLVLQGEDRPLRWAERLRLRLHMAVCDACPKFVGQVRLMRQAIGGWRAYRDGPEDDPPR